MTATSASSFLPDEIAVIGYDDPVVEAHGYGPDHPYISEVLLSVLGPTTTVLWQRLARQLLAGGGVGFTISTADTFGAIGLGHRLGVASPSGRALTRMVQFDAARRAGVNGSVLAIRKALAPRNEWQADHLPLLCRAADDRHSATAAHPGRFRTGRVEISDAAREVLANTRTEASTLIDRHRQGDWGDTSVDEALANNDAVAGGGAIRSVYDLDPATWSVLTVVTAADRRTTWIGGEDED